VRDLRELDRWRITDKAALKHYGGWEGDETCGAFLVPSPLDQRPLVVIASANDAWDHVSVSREKRVPNWHEMSFIHRLFFKNDEVAMQLHVPSPDHINVHPNCLHLWRSHNEKIPLPPSIFV
jgi:hypothetical protein